MTDQPTNQNSASEGTGESPCSAGQVCCSCGGTTDLKYGPDPYAEEIGGNDTPVWECVSCRHERAMDI